MFVMFNATNLLAVLFLIFLEGILSLDNALVLALMVKPLPPAQQKKALTWGIWGAFAFRFIALFFLTKLMQLTAIKLLGGIYLLYIAVKGLVTEEEEPSTAVGSLSLWRTILMVELMDIAFSVDSVMAAVSLTQSYWIVLLGGLLGIVMMRFAAGLFIQLIRAFPRMATTAYLLVFLIGTKLLIEGIDIGGINFHDSKNPESWLFWFAMIGCVFYGFRRRRNLAEAK